MSPKYESLKLKWERGYITRETLRGWVSINERKPGAGITAEEYTAITGESLEDVDLEAMTIPQLKAYAEERGINLSGKTLKADIIAAIRAAL